MGGLQLSAAERRLWDAFPERALADLGDGAKGRDGAEKWGQERTVRGEVIAALLLGARKPRSGRVAAVRLSGARITGPIDVGDGEVIASLELTDCYLESVPSFNGASCKEVRLVGCELPGFNGRLIRTRGSLRLSSCLVQGRVVLRNAHIQGSLHLNDTWLRAAGLHAAGPHSAGLHSAGLHSAGLHGAETEALSAGGIHVEAALFARDLRAEGTLRLIGGTFSGGVFMQGARFSCPGRDTITADNVTVPDHADLSGTVHTGTLSLRGARFGSLSLAGATLENPGGCALHAEHLEVSTYLDGTGGLTADGEVSVNDAHVGTLLDLTGARLRNPGGTALAATGLRADAAMNCGGGFEGSGQIQLYRARVGQHLSFEGARLSNPGGVAVWAEQLEAKELMLRTSRPADGTIDLRDAQVSVLHDDPATWPAELLLNGLAYDALDPPLTAGQRLDWLALDPAYAPGAYEQLSEMYRRLGHGEQARDVQLAKQRRRRQALPPASRAWGYLQDWTVGYGYRPVRAAAGLMLLWAIGSLAFSLHHPPPADGADPSTFQPVIYTLGLLLPVVDFQQEDTFTPQGAQSWLAFLLIAAGWILTTTVAAAILRGLRGERD